MEQSVKVLSHTNGKLGVDERYTYELDKELCELFASKAD